MFANLKNALGQKPLDARGYRAWPLKASSVSAAAVIASLALVGCSSGDSGNGDTSWAPADTTSSGGNPGSGGSHAVTGSDAATDSARSAAEVCGNELDDNGNGLVDEGCPCAAGRKQPCYSGPAETRNTGACKDGVETCASNGELNTIRGMITAWVKCCQAQRSRMESTTTATARSMNRRPLPVGQGVTQAQVVPENPEQTPGPWIVRSLKTATACNAKSRPTRLRADIMGRV